MKPKQTEEPPPIFPAPNALVAAKLKIQHVATIMSIAITSDELERFSLLLAGMEEEKL